MANDETYADDATYEYEPQTMTLDMRTYRHLRAQEMVHGIINAHNVRFERVGAGELATTEVDQLVTVTQAQAIADEVSARLMRAAGEADMDAVWNAYVDEKVMEGPEAAAFFGPLRITDGFPARVVDGPYAEVVTFELNEILDVDVPRGAMASDLMRRFPDGKIVVDAHGRGQLPLSPYDAAFRDRRALYMLGSEPASLRLTDMALAAGELGETFDVSAALRDAARGSSAIDRVSVMRGRGRDARELTVRGEDGESRAVPLFDAELDAGAVYGLSRIRRFMSDADYDDICRAMAASPNFGPARRDNLRAQARNAEAVLAYLEETGLEVTDVDVDMDHHSVGIRFGHDRMAMRLIDVDNPLFACNRISLGPTWGRDQSLYMSFQYQSGEERAQGTYAFTTTPELAVALVKASQGDAVKRYDDVVAGSEAHQRVRALGYAADREHLREAGLNESLVPRDVSREASGNLGEAMPDGSWDAPTRDGYEPRRPGGPARARRNERLPLVSYGTGRGRTVTTSAFAIGPMDSTGVAPIDNADTAAAADWRVSVSRFSSKVAGDERAYANNERLRDQLVLFVKADSSRPVGARTFTEAYAAERYLEAAVASARRGLADEVGLVSGFEADPEAEGDERPSRRTLLAWAETRAEGEDEPEGFVLSGDMRVAAVQQAYMDVICGRTDTLEAPVEGQPDLVRDEGESVVDFLRRHHAALIDAEVGTYEAREVTLPDGSVRRERFCPAAVAEHMVDSGYVTNMFTNSENIVAAMRCVNERGEAESFIAAEELAGSAEANAAMARRLIRFGEGGPETVHDMAELADAREREGRPFMRHMYDEVTGTLRRSGVAADSIDVKIDDAGVIRWTGERHDAGASGEWVEVSGELGQLFEPDGAGMVRTRFKQAGADDESNYSFVPGYVARVSRLRPGEHKTMEERTVLTGYEQTMAARIRAQIASDVMSAPTSVAASGVSLGVPYSLNGAYSALYDERYPVDAKAYFMEQGMDEELFDDIVRMQASRVRYPNNFAEDATAMAAYRAQKGYEGGYFDPANDLVDDAFVRVGCKNVAVLTHACRGIFDETATTMTSANQGSVRYLAQGAHVRADGTIEAYAGDDEAMYKAPLMANPLMRYSDFNPADRNCMTLSNLLQCHAVVGARVAQGFCYGLNFDDGLVVSRDFAEAHAIYPEHGERELRGLMVGDKLSDMHGNKGVIAAVVDPDWTDAECAAHGVPTGARDLFRDNRGKLDVVQASTSLPSRHNGGQASELVDAEKFSLTEADGHVVPAAISTGNFIITNKDADAKTSVYDDEAVAAGRGRKASAQWAWVLDAKDCSIAKREIYGPSADSAVRLREYLLVCGMDMKADGTLMMQSADAVEALGEDFSGRNVVSVPTPADGASRGLFAATMGEGLVPARSAAYNRALSGVLEHEGGFIELPFALTMASGASTFAASSVGREGDGYLLPLMAPGLRCGQEYVDGVQHSHDVTRRYDAICRAASTYAAKKHVFDALHEYYALVDAGQVPDAAKMAELGLDSAALMGNVVNTVNGCATERRDPNFVKKTAFERTGENGVVGIDAAAANKMLAQVRGDIGTYYGVLESGMAAAQARAQAAYDAMASQIKTRYLDGGKHNIFRDNVLARRMRDSATAIWSARPTLDLDEVAIGREMADTIHIAEGDDVLMWRDPVLRTSGVRVMRARVVDDLVGIAINPAMDKCFDGDFDGDTIGVVSMSNFSPAARAELVDAFSAATTILDKGHLHDPDGQTPACDRPRGDYDLNVNDGLDIARYMHECPGASERYEAIRVRANELMRDFDAARDAFAQGRSREQAQALRNARQALTDEVIRPLSDFTHDAFEASSGGFLRYADKADYAESVYESCIKSGAKGNDKKFDGAMPFVGVNAKADGWGGVSFFDAAGNELDRSQAGMAVSDGPFEGDAKARYDHDIEAKTAGCTKTSGTPLAGSFSIRLMSALREMEPTPEAALELTYPVTQGTLQVKHNAEQAAEVFDMLSDSLRKHWRGQLLDNSGNPVTDKQGNVVQAKPEQWAAQFERLYGPDGLDVDYNPEAVEQVASAMQKMVAETDAVVEPGRIPDLEQDSPATLADRLAYAKQGAGFEVLVEAAREGSDLFAGRRTQSLRPCAVRRAVFERDHAGQREERIAHLESVRDSGVSDAVYMSYQDEIDKLEAEGARAKAAATLAAKSTLSDKPYVKKVAQRAAHASAAVRPAAEPVRVTPEPVPTLTHEAQVPVESPEPARMPAPVSASKTCAIDFSRPVGMSPAAPVRSHAPQATPKPVAPEPRQQAQAAQADERKLSDFAAMSYEQQKAMSVEDARWVVSRLSGVDEDSLTDEEWDLKSVASSIEKRHQRQHMASAGGAKARSQATPPAAVVALSQGASVAQAARRPGLGG